MNTKQVQPWEELKEEEMEEELDVEMEMEETGPDLDRGSIPRIMKKSSQRRPSMITSIKWDRPGMQVNVLPTPSIS